MATCTQNVDSPHGQSVSSLRGPVETIDWASLEARNLSRAAAKIEELRTRGKYILDQPIQRPKDAKVLQRLQRSL